MIASVAGVTAQSREAQIYEILRRVAHGTDPYAAAHVTSALHFVKRLQERDLPQDDRRNFERSLDSDLRSILPRLMYESRTWRAVAEQVLLAEAEKLAREPAQELPASQSPSTTSWENERKSLLARVEATEAWQALGEEPSHGQQAQEFVGFCLLRHGDGWFTKMDTLVAAFQRAHHGYGSRASAYRWLKAAREAGVLLRESRPRRGKWGTSIYRIDPAILAEDETSPETP
jgi:hypothetical protein